MKKIYFALTIIINIITFAMLIIIWETPYNFETCVNENECFTISQKIGDYLLGKD